MPLIPRLTSLCRNLFRKDRVDQEFTEEIQAYLDMLTETKISQGLTPREARRNALLELEGVEQVHDAVTQPVEGNRLLLAGVAARHHHL